MPEVDVAIVGAGPAGSAAAITLAERGYQVVLFDKRAFPREKLCGDFVNPINLPLLRRLGVAEQIRAQPHAAVTGFLITSSSGASAEARLPGGAPGLGLRRALLDHALVQRAVQRGAVVRLNSRLDELSPSAAGWRITAQEEGWRAKLLIGADGRNSWVAEQLGLNGGAARHGRSIGFQARLKWSAGAPGRVEIHLFPGGYAGLVGIGGGELNLCLAIDRRALPHAGKNASVVRYLAHNPQLKRVLERSSDEPEFRAAYPVYFPARRCFTERALLAGDAARVSEPVTGEGIYCALQSGLLAAEMVDRALAAGDLSADFLRRYDQRCAGLFRGRMRLNTILRFAVYRPALLDPVIRLLGRKSRWLDALVGAVCTPQPQH